ncbi:choice-of-anchor G family protein [Arthrobacter russicus]|uniref:Gram-positive cocci surface proteins LPxTG domain-containing protein n=1 Tax=Arthrobacter russicus TaxID=172040 RepID=A0ABU1JBL4_9MICC|nr:choice-of-anchor G family protein [Arthrobacter russicus]MDR6269805.1 hypothetical protein [Arthrobacter russicus]
MSGAVAASLLALPLAGSAQAIQSPSGDPVEARGSIVGAFLGGMALAEAGLTSASSVKSPGPDKQPLNLNVFGGKALQLPNINLPIVKNGPGQPGLLDIGGAVGALNSYAAAQAAAGKAAAGAITDSGSIDPSAAQDPSKNINAKIDLRVLLDQLGLDTAHQLISTAEVDANALSSSINATKKPITAADTSYAFADAHARLQLPPVAGLTGLLTSGLDQLKTPINAVIGDTGALNTALKAALAALNVDLVVASLKTTGSTVSITGTDAVVAALAASLPTKIVSKNGGVTLDLTTGLADVDVAKIYNATGGAKDLNGLPPNTDVLDDKMVEALVNGVADVADAVIEKLNTGLKDALLNNLKLTIDLAAKVDLVGGVASANTSINITGTLAQFTGVTGAGDPTITATDLSIKPPLLPPVNIPAGTIVNALKPVLLTALKTVLGTAIDGLNTTLTANPGPIQAIVEPIVKAAGDALSPAFQAIKQVARLIINDQPTLDGRPADIASPTAYSVRALTLVLFPGGLPGFPTPPAPGGGQVPDPRDGLARVSISSSTADFGAAAAAPALAVNPASVPAGGKTSVTGTGWATGTPVSVQLKDPSGANVGAPVSVTPNADGSLPATDLPVPAGSAAGAYTVVGTQGTTPPVSTPLTVTAAATPTIKADPASVPAGGKTSVTGTGWDPASPVSVQLKDAAGANVGSPVSITPGTDGSLPATDLPVPAGTKAGDYTVVGTQGSNTQTAPLTVTDAAAPTIKADPASVPAGGKTSVTGTGWDPASPVSVQLKDAAGANVGSPVSITPGTDGSLPATDLPVPAGTKAGDYTVVGTQGSNTQTAPLTVTDAAAPTIKADPASVPAGTKTSVTGTGWTPGTPVSVQLTDPAGAAVGTPVSITPAADGSLPATDLPVPATATPGAYTVVGTQGSNTQSAPLTVTPAGTPALTVNPTSVPAGKKTSVTGTGWTPGTPVSVQLKDPSGANVGAPVSITPAADGSLPATDLPVPADAKPGNDTVVGTQGATTTSTPLTVTPADGTASANTNASASASASANADSKANAAAQAAAQAAANADATSTASAAANTAANAAAKSAATANATANASADATSAANAQAQAAATAAANSAAQSDTNATASAAATANANAASKAAATANSSTNASAAAAANANATANANANASASAAASANADSKANAAAQAAAQAAANADATSTASAAANTAANAAAKSAATANATANASADATSAANASAQAAATAAANSAAQSDSNAKASAAANANASAAASAASNANSSSSASSNAAADANGNASGIKVTIDRNLVNKGANVVLKVTGTGFKATEKVAGVLFSEQSPLGSQVADANGQVVFTFNSQNLELGDHTVTLTSTVDAAKTGSVSFKVVPAGAGNVNASGSSNGSGDGLANTGSNDPTSIFVGAGIALLLGAALVSIAVSRKRRGTEIGS